MSRIGKKEIAVPSGVQVTLNGQALTVKGPKGQLAYTVPEEIEITHANGVETTADGIEPPQDPAIDVNQHGHDERDHQHRSDEHQ